MSDLNNNKFIIYIYKITSKQDKFKLFIGSSKQKVKSLFSFFLKDIEKNKNHPNNLYKWIKNLEKTFLKIKLLKAYPVNNKEEQREKEKRWINKYKKDGFSVIHNPFNEKNTKKESKLYVCFENISIDDLVLRYKSNILSISKKPFKFLDIKNNENKNLINNKSEIPPPPLFSPNIKILNIKSNKPFNNKPKEKLLPIKGGGYMNELKNLLLKRRNSKLGITEIVQNNLGSNIKRKKINYIPIPINKKPINFVEELKMKMKPLY